MKGMVHFNATRKKAVKRYIKVQYFLRKPIQTNIKKIRSEKSNWFYSHKYFTKNQKIVVLNDILYIEYK